MKNYLFGLLLILITVGCTKDNQASKEDNTIVHETSLTLNDELIEDKSFQSFPKIPTRSFPIVDSTNFDNYKDQDGIKDDLFIEQIEFQKNNPDAENIRLRYRINYSDHYYSAVISYRKGEHELFTTLVNIKENKRIIDQLDIAYDEIAESAFRKTSSIDHNKIVVEDWNYFSEEPIKKTFSYQISKEGKLKKISDQKY